MQENRRKISSLTKPVIRKLIGTDTWVCRYRDVRPQIPGFGLTPSEAYRDWKSWQL